MLTAGKRINVHAQNLVVHEQHPASNLEPTISDRLLNIYLDPEKGERRITKRALLLMAQITPIHVTGKIDKPIAISGWSLVYALKKYNVEELIPCIQVPKISSSAIHEVVLTDFFLTSSSIERQDEIARRIKAICMHTMNNDADLNELIAPNATSPKCFFSLPERRRGTLAKDLEKEPTEVRAFIAAADKPLGVRGTDRQQPGQTVVPTVPIEDVSIPPVANEPVQEDKKGFFHHKNIFFPRSR